MGQSSTFYEIKKTDFNNIKGEPSLFNISETESLETLEKNAFGIEYILKKMLDSKQHITIEQLFFPKDYLGKKPDYENMDFDQFDIDEFEDNSISFLTPEQILIMDNLLRSITENGLKKR